MFKKEYLPFYIRYGLLAAVCFSIPMVIFIAKNHFEGAWWLYVGNVIFFIAITTFVLVFNKMKGSDTSTQTMIAAGHITVITGILISLIIALVALIVYNPSMFSSAPSNTPILRDAPADTGTGETHGIIFILLMSTIIGNFIAGSFASIIIPYTAKRNQTKDRKSEVLNN